MSFSQPTLVKFRYTETNIPIIESSTRQKPTKFHRDNVPRHIQDNSFIDWSRESYTTTPRITSRKWIIIVLTGIIVGYVTTFLDLTSAWLNDLKKGICHSKRDQWSLLNPYLTCPVDQWHNWSEIMFGSNGPITAIFVNFPIFLILAVLLVGGAAYITIERLPVIRHSGISEIKIIISGFEYKIDSYLGLPAFLYKTLGLILVVGSGVWLGKEGPLVHVSCCVVNVLYELLVTPSDRSEGLRRELLSAAAATGIAAAFNAPIGGVLFVLECMPTYFMPTRIMWNSFVATTVAVVVLTGSKVFTEGHNFDEQDLFLVEFGNFSWLFLETIPFVLLGAIGGVYGHYFVKVNRVFSSVDFKSRVHSKLLSICKISDPKCGNYIEIVLIAIITSFVNFPLQISKLPLNAYLKALFLDCPVSEDLTQNSSNFMCLASSGVTVMKLLFIVVQGSILAAYTYGVYLPGGVLTPSLVLGATTGRLLGIISQLLQRALSWDSLATCTKNSCIVSPSSYAVVGAAAFGAGITKFTMSIVVIMFELTGALTYVLPIMCAVMVLKFVNDLLSNYNIYDSWLKSTFNRGLEYMGPVNEGKGDGMCDFTNATSRVKQKLPDVPVLSVMVQPRLLYIVPDTDYTISLILDFVNGDNHEGYPLLLSTREPVSLGYITKVNIRDAVLSIEHEPHDMVISLQVSGLPDIALSQQLHYERNLGQFIKLDIAPDVPNVIVNESCRLVQVLEMFEKLHLNYLLVVSSKDDHRILRGFVDRYILAELIQREFTGLYDYSDYELDDVVRDRHSFELVT